MYTNCVLCSLYGKSSVFYLKPADDFDEESMEAGEEVDSDDDDSDDDFHDDVEEGDEDVSSFVNYLLKINLNIFYSSHRAQWNAMFSPLHMTTLWKVLM